MRLTRSTHGGSLQATECAALPPNATIAAGATFRTDDTTDVGTELYQCCIRPWMRGDRYCHAIAAIELLLMRHLSAVLILGVTGCVSSLSGPVDAAQPTAYTLLAVNDDSLPAAADRAAAPRWVLSGSLVLRPDGYYVLSESDSVWNGHSFARVDRREGGIWMADGTMLTLTDSATEASDSYGSGSSAYFGTIAPNVVVLTMPSEGGNDSDVYRYIRK